MSSLNPEIRAVEYDVGTTRKHSFDLTAEDKLLATIVWWDCSTCGQRFSVKEFRDHHQDRHGQGAAP